MPRLPDLLAILVTTALVAASYLSWGFVGSGASMLQINTAAGALTPVALDQVRSLRLDGPLGTTVVEVAESRARIAESPCPDQRCVLRGWLDAGGASAVCLPNRVSITLSGAPEGYDAITF